MGMENEICSNCKGLIRKGPTVKTADGKPFTMKYCPCTDEINAIWNKKMTTTPTETATTPQEDTKMKLEIRRDWDYSKNQFRYLVCKLKGPWIFETYDLAEAEKAVREAK